MSEDSYDSEINEFRHECDLALSFLTTEYGFSVQNVDDNRIHFFKVIYVSSTVAVECIFDLREDDVTVKLVKLDNGELPEAYETDQHGRLVREHITQLLLRRGIRDLSFREPDFDPSISNRQKGYRKALQGYARLLRQYCESALLGSTDIFEPLQ